MANVAEEELQETLPEEIEEESEEEKIIYLTEASEAMFEEEVLAKEAKKEGQIARRHIYTSYSSFGYQYPDCSLFYLSFNAPSEAKSDRIFRE